MLAKEEGRKNLPEVIEMFKRWKIEREELNNEEDVKALIEELFIKVLGWDKDDIYRERHPGPTSKRADFQFRDKGSVKLILETKKLDEPWTGKVKSQAIGYGWSSNKEYVVLTNFRSFILFNAKWKDKDKRIFEIENIEDCLKFSDKFDRLWLLSKESFLNGEIDRFSEDIGKKLKKQSICEINRQLLNDLKRWREMLTKDIKNLNKLTEEEIDEVVQKIINRFIFIRACEDRGLSPTITDMISYLRLWQEKRAKPLLEHLLLIFHHYDNIYDGTIFQKDDLCERIEIHNNVLEKIIEQLYIAEGLDIEYNFSLIDADVLGSVYEEYLGYLLKGKKITENHVHRKEQGIYYTPTYIVDYIVRNTLGEVLKQGKEIDKIKILDPACGSGSFLIKAFDVISEFYKEKIGEEKFNREIKNSILTNNLYGVDLDEKAVEIAQLNLFLKIGEKGELPKLRENIKNGNSLIDDEKVSDKAFKWKEEFEDIMKEEGFDIIVGNPPYGADFNKNEIEYLKTENKTLKSKDSAEYFIKRALQLLKPNGILGFIIPKTLAFYESWKGIRQYLLNNFTILNIADVGIGFQEVNLEEIIIIVKKEKSDKYLTEVEKFSDIKRYKPQKAIESSEKVDSKLMLKNQIIIFSPLTKEQQNVLNKIEDNSFKFSSIIEDAFRGIYIPENKKQYLADGKIKFIEKGPWLKRYRLERYLSVDLNEKIINRNKAKKIMVPRLLFKVLRGKRLVVFYDDRGQYLTTEKLVNVIFKDKNENLYKTLLGLFNSSLLSFYVQKTLFSDTTETARVMDYPYISLFPIPKNIKQISEQKIIVKYVDKILSLNKRFNELSQKETSEREKIDEEIGITDNEIDEFVYKLYDVETKKKVIEEN